MFKLSDLIDNKDEISKRYTGVVNEMKNRLSNRETLITKCERQR